MMRTTKYTSLNKGNRRVGKVKEPPPFDKAFLTLERVLADINSAGGRLVLLFLVFLVCLAWTAFGVSGGKLGALAALYALLWV
jgi:hypothetical protein